MEHRTIEVHVLENPNLKDLPKLETDGSAAMDVVACTDRPIHIQPGQRVLIPTGLKVAIPFGFKINVLPRSGNAYKKGITVLNTPGLIDSDYRGEIGVILINTGEETFTVLPGERIAQIEIAPVYFIKWKSVPVLSETVRGEGGFGSTGVRSEVIVNEAGRLAIKDSEISGD